MTPAPQQGRQPTVVLASASPRRRALLAAAIPGDQLRVTPADIDERAAGRGLAPAEAVQNVARVKASHLMTGLAGSESTVVVAADTTVIGPRGAVGKPRDRTDAHSMIMAMSGTTITILTGLVIGRWPSPDQEPTLMAELESSSATLRPFTESEVAAYVATGAADDKAGGLELQDRAAHLIASHDGCFTNTMGLPLCRTVRAIMSHHSTGDGLRKSAVPTCWSFAPLDLQPRLVPQDAAGHPRACLIVSPPIAAPRTGRD